MAEEILEKKDVTPASDEGKDPLKEEPSHKSKYTPQEKVAYNLRKIAEEAVKLGVDPTEIVGSKPLKIDVDLDDNTPLTVGTFKEMQKREAQKTSLQLAEEIEDEDEKREVKNILENHLKSSGDSQKDLSLARAAANAVRTEQVAREQARKTQAMKTAAGGSAPGKTENQFEPTTEELAFMGPPWNLSKEKILAARKGKE